MTESGTEPKRGTGKMRRKAEAWQPCRYVQIDWVRMINAVRSHAFEGFILARRKLTGAVEQSIGEHQPAEDIRAAADRGEPDHAHDTEGAVEVERA